MAGKPSVIGQSIDITGLGLKNFDDAIAALANIRSLFAADAACGDLKQLNMAEKHGFSCLRISNRFLTPKVNAAGEEEDRKSLAIIDPHGYLKKVAKDGYIHHVENAVQYYRLRATNAEEYTL